MMTKADWSTFRGTSSAIILSLDEQTTLEYPSRDLVTPLDFERYLAGLRFEAGLRHTLDLTFHALMDYAEALEAAHNLAAATVVPEPKPQAVALMIESLEIISADLQRDQRFGAVVEVASAAAEAMKSVS